MLYLNAKELDLSNESKDYEFAPIVADYYAYITELKSRFGSNVLYFTRQRPKRDEKTGNLRPVPLRSWPKTQTGVRIEILGRDRPIGPFSLVYSKEQLEVEKGKPILNDKNFLVREGELTVDLTNEPDFAYFLHFHNVMRSGELYINDPARTANARADEFKRKQKVSDLLFSEYSPLNKDPEKLKTVSRRWGLSGVDVLTHNEIAVSLYDMVMGNEEAKKRNPGLRGVNEFLKDTQLGASVKAGELVSIAEDKGVLKYNQTHAEFQIIYPGRLAATPYLSVPPEKIGIMRDYLIDALVMDDQLMRKLEGVIGIEPKDREVAFEMDKLDDYKYPELQSIAASYGLKPIGKKTAELKEMIREAFTEQRV